jgi:hypothetical protein
VAPEDHPVWVKDAVVLPYVKQGAALLNRLMPEDVAVRSLGAALLLPRHGLARRALVHLARIPGRS